MLERYGSSLESDGMISSVVMLSPAWRTTLASTFSGRAVFLRERFDVRSHSHFCIVFIAAFRIYDKVIVWHKICFRDLRQFFTAGHAVGQHTFDSGKRCSFRAYKEHLRIQRSASALEVSVKCTQGNGSGFRGLSHADAWSACVFDDTCSGVDDISQCTVAAPSWT